MRCPGIPTGSAADAAAASTPGVPVAAAARPRWVAWFLAALVLFFLVNNTAWLLTDATPPAYDRSVHTISALKYLRLMEAPSRLSLHKLLTVTRYWPPLFHLSSVPFTAVLGFSVQSVAATNFLFLVVLVYGVYGIGRRLFDDAVGVGAAVLTLFYPIVFALSRDVLVDFSLTAMVALSLYFVIESDGGLNPRRSAALGAAMGGAMLAKWTAGIFIAGPALLWFALHVKDRRRDVRTAVLSLALMAGMFALVALPWYLTSLKEFSAGASVALGFDPSREGDPSAFWPSVVWYWRTIFDVLIMRAEFPVTVFGLALYTLRVRAWKATAFLLAWLMPAAAFFLLLPNKDGRFVVQMLPAVALLTAAGLQQIPWRALRLQAWSLAVIAGLYSFYTISFGWPTPQANYYTHVPSRAEWKQAHILAALNTMRPGKRYRIAVLANEPSFEPNTFKVVSEVRNLGYQIDGLGDSHEPLDRVADYDVLISKTGHLAIEHTARWREVFRSDLAAWIAAGRAAPRFRLWRTWLLPDGSQAEVYLIE